MNAVKRYFKSLLLLELFKGLGVTQKYFFRPKFTINRVDTFFYRVNKPL